MRRRNHRGAKPPRRGKSVRLKFLAKIKTNFPGADFWLVRKGSSEAAWGRPTRTFSKDHIGIKVTRTDIVLPTYLFYVMQYLYDQKYWRRLAQGSTRTKHILTRDVKEIRLEMQ